MRKAWLVMVSPMLAACFGPSLGDTPFTCGPGDVCPADYHCEQGLCLRDGLHLIDAGPGKCIPNTVSCVGDTLVQCDGSGAVNSSIDCAVGCNASLRTPRCYVLTPSNIKDDTCDKTPSATLLMSSDTVLDTRTCGTGASDFEGQSGGAPDLCVFHYQNISIPPGTTLRIVGPYMAVLVATMAFDVQGTIDAGGHFRNDATPIVPGPGSTPQNLGTGGGPANAGDGGGGGGYVTKGFNGGSGSVAGNLPTNGGSMYGGASLVPLRAGSFGGVGDQGCPAVGPCLARGDGGGGGGGLQLVACKSLTISGSAIINAGGGGGGGGTGGTLAMKPSAGSGGGSGGAILIEAPLVSIPSGAKIVANGGGGGGGGLGSLSTTAGAHGQPGSDSTLTSVSRAAGGPGGGVGAGNGGDGSDFDGMTGLTGTAGSSAAETGGGGGGAGGRIRLNARPDKPVTLIGGAILSPFSSSGSGQIGSIARH